MGVTGLILCNTWAEDEIKTKYGLTGKPGGMSGDDWEYRYLATAFTEEVYTRSEGQLEIIGVGGISKAEHAIQRMMAGASLVQVVTDIRRSWGRSAVNINRGILEWMERVGVKNIQEIIGVASSRGVKYPKVKPETTSRLLHLVSDGRLMMLDRR